LRGMRWGRSDWREVVVAPAKPIILHSRSARVSSCCVGSKQPVADWLPWKVFLQCVAANRAAAWAIVTNHDGDSIDVQIGPLKLRECCRRGKPNSASGSRHEPWNHSAHQVRLRRRSPTLSAPRPRLFASSTSASRRTWCPSKRVAVVGLLVPYCGMVSRYSRAAVVPSLVETRPSSRSRTR